VFYDKSSHSAGDTKNFYIKQQYDMINQHRFCGLVDKSKNL